MSAIEYTAEERAAIEEQRDRDIDAYRGAARGHLSAMREELRGIERAVQRLGATDLYDVEVAETHAAVLIANACAQIDIALAALDHAIPKPEVG